MIQVFFDISVLGFSLVTPQARTGVYQVVDNLARGLLAAPDLTVNFCAPASLLHHLQARHWLRRQKGTIAKAADFAGGDPLPPAARLLDILLSVIIQGGRTFGTGGALPKPWQDLLTAINRTATAVTRRLAPDVLLPRTQLASTDVYHSPFHPLPHDARRAKGRCRFILTVHDLIPIKFPHYFSGKNTLALQRTLATLSPEDWVLCVSQSTRRDLMDYRPDLAPERLLVTHLAAAPRFTPCRDPGSIRAVRQRYRIPAEAPYLLGLGTLEPRKNVTATIRAFLALTDEEKFGDLHLVLAGPLGWQYEEILAAAGASAAARHRILFPGYVADADLPALYSGATAFVYPSRYEGFGLPVLEAMACGTPVVAANTASLPEVVGRAGILVDPEDSAGLAEAIRRLCEEKDFREQMARRALRRADEFTWTRTVEETIACYRRAMTGR